MAEETEAQRRQRIRESWQFRVWALTDGKPVGQWVAAILAKPARRYMDRVGPGALITKDGYVIANMIRDNVAIGPRILGSVERVRDALRRVADEAALNDVERIEFFLEVNRWATKYGNYFEQNEAADIIPPTVH